MLPAPSTVNLPFAYISPDRLPPFLPVVPTVKSVNTPWFGLSKPIVTPFILPTSGADVLISNSFDFITSFSGSIITSPPSVPLLFGDNLIVVPSF